MSAIPHPKRDKRDWQRVTIGGTVWPGKLTEVSVPARKYNWTVQRGFGLSMETAFQSVDILSGISFTHFLNLTESGPDDWALLETIMKTLVTGWPNNVQIKPKSLPVVYPLLQYLGAQRIHLAEFYAPEPPPGEKIPQFYKIVFQEDVPKKKLITGPAENAQLNGVPPPKDAAELANYAALADLKGISLQTLLARPTTPTSPAAIATGKASK